MDKKTYFQVFFKTTACLLLTIALIAGISSFFGRGHLESHMDKKTTKRHNILVMGTDKDGTRSDVMMIISLGTKDNSVNIMSIPRDTRVILKNQYAKINAAIGYGDETAINTVKEATQIPIHDYVKFNFKAVEDIIDKLGGIKFNVPQDMDYEDPYQDLYIHLKQGEQKLNGEQTLQLMRFRKYPMGDLQRIAVQQEVIKEIIHQKGKLRYIFKSGGIYKAVKENVATTLNGGEITKLAFSMVGVKEDNIKTIECPYHFSPSGTYVVINENELKEIVENYFE